MASTRRHREDRGPDTVGGTERCRGFVRVATGQSISQSSAPVVSDGRCRGSNPHFRTGVNPLSPEQVNERLHAAVPNSIVYLVGAGGCGVSGLGHLLLDLGFSVAGFDLAPDEE